MAETDFISNKLTLEGNQLALDKVKAHFEKDGCSLVIVTADRYREAIDIIANHFIPDEPLSNAFGVVFGESFERITIGLLQQHLSVMMLSTHDNTVMGVLITGVIKESDEDDYGSVTDEPLRELLKLLSHKDKEVGFYSRYGIKEAMHLFTLGVHKDYRCHGVGTKLSEACLVLSKTLGFKVARAELTSAYTQKIGENIGMDELYEISYDTHTVKGMPIGEKTGVHTKTKVVAKVL